MVLSFIPSEIFAFRHFDNSSADILNQTAVLRNCISVIRIFWLTSIFKNGYKEQKFAMVTMSTG